MKKIILFLLLFPSLLFAAEKEYYHTKINNADVYITSLKSFPRDNSILIIYNDAAKYSKKIFPNGKYTTNTNIVIIKKGKNTLIVGAHTPFYKPVTWK